MRFRPNAAQVALFGTNFLMWGGFFMVIPLVTVHFVTHLGWAAASVGTVLAARQLTQQGLTVFGGALADRVGPKPLMLLGFATRAVGFAAMGFADGFAALLVASLLAGVGGSLFEAPKNAAVSAVTRPQDLTAMFVVMGVCGNLGMVLGPLVGAFLVGFDFRAVALVAGSVYLVALALVALAVPPVGGSVTARSLDGLRAAALDRRFRTFTLMLAGFFLLNSQINVALTLEAVRLGGDGATGPLYAVQAGLALVLQYPVLRLAGRVASPPTILVSGILLTAVALGLVGLVGSFGALLACVALFAVGSMVVVPTQQAVTAQLAGPGTYGSYFGFGALSLGVGGAVGNLVGGTLVDLGAAWGLPALPWVTLMAVGLLTAHGTRSALRDLPSQPAAAPPVPAAPDPALRPAPSRMA